MSTAADLSCDCCGVDLSAYLRVAALAISVYDWLWTIPVEVEIYSAETSLFNLSRPCVLFIMIRYVSIITVISNCVGYFSHNFSYEMCARYMWLSPVMKPIQSLIAHIILFVRTWAISGRAQWVFWALSMMLAATVTLEFYSTLYRRAPLQNEPGNCSSVDASGLKIAWVFYLVCMVYEGLCIAIATGYLWMQSVSISGIHGLARVLLKEGLVYFTFLTAVNILNLIIYIVAPLNSQTAAAALGFALTWIMAQRILIQLHKLRGGVRARSFSLSLDAASGIGGLAEQDQTKESSVHALTFHTQSPPVVSWKSRSTPMVGDEAVVAQGSAIELSAQMGTATRSRRASVDLVMLCTVLSVCLVSMISG
ncbi:hypothetical protein BKA93DRAFT_310113 [Sparassis latifolia]